MRDPNRIPKVLARLQALWLTCPDLRFAQLLGNVICEDPYHMEDEDFIKMVEEFYEELESQGQ